MYGNILSRTFIKIVSFSNQSNIIGKRTKTIHLSRHNYSNIVNLPEQNPKNKNHQCLINKSIKNISRFNSTLNQIKLNRIESKQLDEEIYRGLMNTLPELLQDLKKFDVLAIPEIDKHVENVLNYNLVHGEYLRGSWLIAAYKMVEKPEQLTEENVRLANILAWCVHLQEAAGFILDDIMDQANTRRGRTCWYKNDKVGLNALNDSLFLENAPFLILKNHLSNHPQYSQIVNTYHDMVLLTTLGQTLDILLSSNERIYLFTKDTMKTLVKYKSGYGFLYQPFLVAMYLANYGNPEQYTDARTIMFDMADLFQMQNDFVDCFSKFEITGRMGNDIQKGKCTWLITSALERANSAQKEIIKEHYGIDKVESAKIIRGLYEELNLPELYSQERIHLFNHIQEEIGQMKELPQDLFYNLLARIFAEEH